MCFYTNCTLNIGMLNYLKKRIQKEKKGKKNNHELVNSKQTNKQANKQAYKFIYLTKY